MITVSNAAPRPSMLVAFQSRNFRLWWISLLVSGSGTWLQTVALEALIYEMQGRALDLGLISMVRAVTLISLAFVGGTVADRLDKRKLIMVTQTLFALTAVLLGVLAHQVPREHLMNATALNSITFTGAAAIGAVYAIKLPPAAPRPPENVRQAWFICADA